MDFIIISSTGTDFSKSKTTGLESTPPNTTLILFPVTDIEQLKDVNSSVFLSLNFSNDVFGLPLGIIISLTIDSFEKVCGLIPSPL